MVRGELVGHVFLVSFPGQGHVNPLLRLGKRLASKGLLVTFCTPEFWSKEMRKASGHMSEEATPIGDGFIRFESFEDGWEEEDARRQDLDQYLPQLEKAGKEALPGMIKVHSQKVPVTCLINNPFISWVADVAESVSLPWAMLWVQSCASFSAYYHYYHKVVPYPSESEPHIDVQLPCMPLLRFDEVPSFLHPTTRDPFLRRAIMAQFASLDKVKPICILTDTFEELEKDVFDYMSSICPAIKPVGPLFIEATPRVKVVKGDLLKADGECMEWLNSKLPGSVVYVSFGSVVYLKQEQVDEIAYGLLESGLSFLWVMKPPHKDSGNKPHVLPQGLMEKAGERGKVVKWSPQGEVLAHPSLLCFVTHCGWNSSMEAITSGVPLVAFPQWGDQVTNAKYLVDVLGVAVRMGKGEAANELIKRDQVKQCLLEATVGDKASSIKLNVLKWKAAAEAAVALGGSSDRNIQAFVDQLRNQQTN